MIRRLVPQFDVSVWLQVEPRVAMARDNDFDLPYYEELHTAYSAAAGWLGWRVIPEQGRTPEEVHAAVAEELGLVPAPGRNGLRSPQGTLV